MRGLQVASGDVRVGCVVQDGVEETIQVTEEEGGIVVGGAESPNHDFLPAIEVDDVLFPVCDYCCTHVCSRGASIYWRHVDDEEVASTDLI